MRLLNLSTSLICLLLIASLPARADVTPEAEKLLAQLSEAGATLKSVSINGTVTNDFDVSGMKDHSTREFQSSWIDTGAFRQSVKDDAVMGYTGEKLYQLELRGNRYAQLDAKSPPRQFPEDVRSFLLGQNPQLLLVGQSDAAAIVKKTFPTITTGPSEKLADREVDSLILSNENRVVTMLADPKSHFLRQVRIDVSGQLKQRGATAINKALITIAYTRVEPDAALKPEQFAWTPPEGARNMADDKPGENFAAKALEGKPAPAFSLKSLDGKDVSLADFKGKVVVADFWATWCGPCVVSLPHLDKLAQDRAKDGLVVLALNQQEEKDTVQAFITKQKLSLNVLFDSEGTAAKDYLVEGIPQTVVIAKDGVVKKVFQGFNPNDGGKALDDVVADALKQ